MSDELTLHATKRTDVGKGASRRLRRLNNAIPAILYGGEHTPEMLTLDHNKLLRFMENEGVYSQILTIDVEGKAQKAVLKAIQRHPFKPKILHMDFLRITGKEKITMHIPLHFKGEEEAPGVKEGGIVSHYLTEVEVSCLPKDLPEFIEVDISKLTLDQAIHLSELTYPKNITLVALMHEQDNPVVAIHLPRVVAETEEAEVTEEPSEGLSEAEATDKPAEDN